MKTQKEYVIYLDDSSGAPYRICGFKDKSKAEYQSDRLKKKCSKDQIITIIEENVWVKVENV